MRKYPSTQAALKSQPISGLNTSALAAAMPSRCSSALRRWRIATAQSRVSDVGMVVLAIAIRLPGEWAWFALLASIPRLP